MENKVKKVFSEIFDHPAQGTYFAPGRVNLIGEHTDYNGGYVFPVPITLGTYAAVRKREDRLVRLYSENFSEKGIIEFTLGDLTYKEIDDWANYPKGMLFFLKEAGFSINSGLDIAFYGNIPNSAGLSSSASIELLMGVILQDLFELSITTLDLVKLGQKTENQFIGVNSGIMDQFAVGMGQSDHALLLDTNTLDYEVVPAEFGEYVIAIMNTNKSRKLADSKYNERRKECEQALQYLQKELSIQSLGELENKDLVANAALIEDEILFKRAKHAVTENERTKKAKIALEKGDLVEFGELLNASHTSLQNDYEVTGKELDTLVFVAQQHPAVLGARMTGAGFGGCAIALVKKTFWQDFVKDVSQTYLDNIGYATDIYQASIDDGARKL
ncbi:galactokinase [Tetragenococcus halophilus]|uniref:galactokinase n=1 Tax=Tetragenococcus halophilus TaxID=51669 RepID=UPI000CA75E3D|nr:galactokinase [Tetragenococcus halophilus]RQD33244.1 galactokinase [Tetragenococcus halophilus subsp. halophilus DSM 20339]GBD58250.1 galactokinase [Tetragenococcus halophilus subsp. halophilus]GBD72912.1 galactokinase [Tetragenococcus halophilus subsp. halophilus]GBD75561.1 galactokinase [Tetragenococcus halophilus subsp. halophilus]GLL51843.1 galactokinase [Tetragenococcus halophilus]